MAKDIQRKDKSKDAIASEQLTRMCDRYAVVLDGRVQLDPTDAPPNLIRARACVEAARGALSSGQIANARHLIGFVQGILLCTGIHTWEYLATDDQRE